MKTRNQRQRKKLHLAEFQELGFFGKCDESHRQLVQKWLEENKLQQIEISELFDIWWDYPTKNA